MTPMTEPSEPGEAFPSVYTVRTEGTPEPIRGPGEFADWDAGREEPKGLAEAKGALAARVVDPTAPDRVTELGAYDHLES